MFPDRLKYLRKKEKLTQQDMADFLDITRQGYGKLENGRSESNHEAIKKIAKRFNVTIDFLLGHEDHFERETEPELAEFIEDLKIWYANEPEARNDLVFFRRIMQTYNKDKE